MTSAELGTPAHPGYERNQVEKLTREVEALRRDLEAMRDALKRCAACHGVPVPDKNSG